MDHGHITDCKLDSVVYAGVCMWVNVDLSCLDWRSSPNTFGVNSNRSNSTVPWGTPDQTGAWSDDSPSHTTHMVQPVRNAWIHLFNGPCMPHDASFPSEHSWGTVSKARLKSRMPKLTSAITSTCLRRSKDWIEILLVRSNCDSQEWSFLLGFEQLLMVQKS